MLHIIICDSKNFVPCLHQLVCSANQQLIIPNLELLISSLLKKLKQICLNVISFYIE